MNIIYNYIDNYYFTLKIEYFNIEYWVFEYDFFSKILLRKLRIEIYTIIKLIIVK